MSIPDGFSFAPGTRPPAAKQLDGSSRMSARYQVRIVTERAERTYANIDSAKRAFAQMASENRRAPSVRNRNSPISASGRTKVRGRGGRTYDNSSMLAMNLETNVKNIQGKTEEAFIEAMEIGVELVKINLVYAETGWGRYRFFQLKEGGSPGRDYSGDMIKAVTWNVSKTSWSTLPEKWDNKTVAKRFTKGIRTTSISGYFGWDKPPLYMIAQEKGFRHARGSSGSFESKTSTGIRRQNADTSLQVEGAMSLGYSMVAVRNILLAKLREINNRPRATRSRKK